MLQRMYGCFQLHRAVKLSPKDRRTNVVILRVHIHTDECTLTVGPVLRLRRKWKPNAGTPQRSKLRAAMQDSGWQRKYKSINSESPRFNADCWSPDSIAPRPRSIVARSSAVLAARKTIQITPIAGRSSAGTGRPDLPTRRMCRTVRPDLRPWRRSDWRRESCSGGERRRSVSPAGDRGFR